MSKILKRISKIIIPICLLFMLGISNVFADTSLTQWSGSVDTNYYGVGRQKKSTSSSHAYEVKWTDTNKDGYFRLFVRVIQSDNIYNQLTKAAIELDARYSKSTIGTVNGKTYVLQAARENIFDPKTDVSGNWKIN